MLWLHSNRVNALLVNQDMCPVASREPREGERRNERKEGEKKKRKNIAFLLIWSLNFTEVLPVIPSLHSGTW